MVSLITRYNFGTDSIYKVTLQPAAFLVNRKSPMGIWKKSYRGGMRELAGKVRWGY